MSTKHTPGPWQAGRRDTGTIVDGYESKWIYAGQKYIAAAWGGDVSNWEEVMANAELIARAPDLLAENEPLRPALKELGEAADGWDRGIIGSDTEFKVALARAKEVVK